jgi:hypothetical protein
VQVDFYLLIFFNSFTKKKDKFSVYFPFRSASHEVPEPLRTHRFIDVLHTKPLQHDLPNKPEHFLLALAQPNNLNFYKF